MTGLRLLLSVSKGKVSRIACTTGEEYDHPVSSLYRLNVMSGYHPHSYRASGELLKCPRTTHADSCRARRGWEEAERAAAAGDIDDYEASSGAEAEQIHVPVHLPARFKLLSRYGAL